MSYQALYRKYRPKTFNEIAGQEHITKTIKNALKNNKFSHAYIFSGPRGTGKTTIAKIIAKTLNCEKYPIDEPCENCKNCQDINNNNFSDIYEIDAASNNGVDEIRDLREKIGYLPAQGRYKVYIIDEVHMLTTGAFNALLKTLEEPPKHVVFILATTELYKVPATILSRCQKFDFRQISDIDMYNKLEEIINKENIKITKDGINAIIKNSNGGLRDALSLLDQLISYSNNITDEDVYSLTGNITDDYFIKIINNIINKDLISNFKIIDELLKNGKEISRILIDMIDFLKNILIVKHEEDYDKFEILQLSKKLNEEDIFKYIEFLNDTLNDIKYTLQKRTYLDLAFIKMTDYNSNTNIKELNSNTSHINQNIKEDKKVNNKEEIKDEYKFISIKDIEDILNNPNKDKKLEIQKNYDIIKNNLNLNDNLTLEAVSINNIALFTTDLLFKANAILNSDIKDKIIKEINKFVKINDIIIITEDKWKIILNDFIEQYKINKKPHLKEIDLGIEIKINNKEEKDIYQEAINIFGKDKVEIKEN